MKKLTYSLLLICFAASFFQCKGSRKTAKNSLSNQEATVIIYRCGRGCVNYLLKTTINNQKQELYPINLPEDKQKENLLVRFDGELLTEMQQLYYPGPTDMPVAGKKVQQVRIDKIDVQK
jgi:hypothetical protein